MKIFECLSLISFAVGTLSLIIAYGNKKKLKEISSKLNTLDEKINCLEKVMDVFERDQNTLSDETFRNRENLSNIIIDMENLSSRIKAELYLFRNEQEDMINGIFDISEFVDEWYIRDEKRRKSRRNRIVNYRRRRY